MPTRFFSARAYYWALAVVAGLFASTLYNRVAHFDDAWFAEQAYWLRRDGYVHSELFRGLNDWETQLFVFHKAYIYSLAALMSVLGESIWAVKITSLLFILAGLALLVRYFRGSREAQWLAAILYLGSGAIMMFGFSGRPEVMVMTCGLGSYMALVLPAAGPRRFAALAGALAGLAALAHLNGIVYLVAGGGWLLLQRGPDGRISWARVWAFSLAGGAVFGLYFLDAAVLGKLPVLVSQFLHDPVNGSNLTIRHKLEVMAEFFSIFTHSDAELPITILFASAVLLVLVGRRPAGPRVSPALRYLLLLLVTFWLLTKSATAYYQLLFVPFFIIVSVECVLQARELPVWRRQLLLLLFALYPVGTLLRARYLWHENVTYPHPQLENTKLAAHMPCKGVKVIAPLDFIFGQFDHYTIHGLTIFAYMSDGEFGGNMPVEKFFEVADKEDATYVVADYRTFNNAYHIKPDAPVRIGKYQRIYQTQWYGLYARQPTCQPAATP